MKKYCLNCGKELQNHKNKFCDRSCAASFNNKNRKRNKWDIDQKQKFSEKSIKNIDKHIGYNKYICKYCGEITNKSSYVCSTCKPYVNRIKIYKQFGIISGSLKYRNEKLKQLLYEEYFINEKSTIMIEKEYNVSNQSIWNILKREFGGCRNLSEGVSLAFKEGRLNISISDKTEYQYKTGTHISWDGKKYKYRSSWEDQYMTELDKNKIKYQYEPFCVTYFNTIKQCNKLAFPDFYLPETNEIIELKSSYTLGDIQIMKDKFKAYLALGYKPKLLLDWKYVNI